MPGGRKRSYSRHGLTSPQPRGSCAKCRVGSSFVRCSLLLCETAALRSIDILACLVHLRVTRVYGILNTTCQTKRELRLTILADGYIWLRYTWKLTIRYRRFAPKDVGCKTTSPPLSGENPFTCGLWLLVRCCGPTECVDVLGIHDRGYRYFFTIRPEYSVRLHTSFCGEGTALR